MAKTALIDGDVIRYQLGYATQHREWKVLGKVFSEKALAEDYMNQEQVPSGMLETYFTSDIKEMVRYTVDKFLSNILESAKCDKMKVFLTGDNNYRVHLASIQPYKGHRKGDKPLNFQFISDYLIKKYNAIVIEDAEADDAMGWNQTDDTVICTIDKDLKMIKGNHYNWKSNKLFTVSESEADRFFYTQLLTGDSVDNIEGCPGIGEKRAKKILKGRETVAQMYVACVEAYYQSHAKFSEKHQLTCTERMLREGSLRDLIENAHLLWIQREKNVRWEPPS